MNFLRRPLEPLPPLARDAGVDARRGTAPADPIAAWIDLMDTVEALRPQRAYQRGRAPYEMSDYVYKL